MSIALFNYVLFFALFALALEFTIDQVNEMRTGEPKLLGIGKAYGWSKLGYLPIIILMVACMVVATGFITTIPMRIEVPVANHAASLMTAFFFVVAVKFTLYSKGIQSSPFGVQMSRVFLTGSLICLPMFGIAATSSIC